MTVSELIDLLSEQDPDAPVRIMLQPTYPLESNVAGIWANDSGDPDDAFIEDDEDTGKRPVFIVEGNQRGYGTKRAWDEVTTR